MDNRIYVLAQLNEEQLKVVREAEQSLGPISLVMFQPVEADIAKLNESQVECLKGLEQKLGLTAVACFK